MTLLTRVRDTDDYRSLDYRPPPEVRWGLLAAAVPIAFFVLEPVLIGALAVAGVRVSGIPSLVLGVGAYLLTVVWAVLVSRRRGLGSLRRDFGFAFRWIDLAIGLGAAIAVEIIRVIIGIVLVSVTPARPTTNVHLSSDPLANVALGVVAVIVAPVVEELLTRGLLMRAIRNAILRRRPEPSEGRRHWAADASVLLSAAIFTALHLHEAPDLVSAVNLVLGIFPIGLVVAWLATRTGRLGPGIVTHALVNGLALAVALAVQR
ncbi:CPBP family glutamic-type intramembrane protease [Amnibacterium sp. CER49]|uniref:CPBP family intramembrane glutamic endopeptidase n=1 Tax=Amnibacterium sp. CER49 TaxID=3039161 RepID=UPI0024491F1E|nr:CPBP family intramembrane glutamic endopeptidase [Amnibacterium sp. CER49]MDH2444219.1 CPBP family glutamic-type intramembrane protease [Amnibacterium sp. CER49]